VSTLTSETRDEVGTVGTPPPLSGAARVTGEGGWSGTLLEAPPVVGSSPERPVMVRMDSDGSQLVVPAGLLQPRDDGTFFVPIPRAVLEGFGTEEATRVSVPRAASVERSVERIVVPLHAEEMIVTTRRAPVGGVRLHKRVLERQEVLDQPVFRDHANVERVTVNRMVEGTPPSVRHEGDTMIVPLLEEVLVVEKRLMVREELHVRLSRVLERDTQTVTLRREEAQVERFAPGDSRPATDAPDGA